MTSWSRAGIVALTLLAVACEKGDGSTANDARGAVGNPKPGRPGSRIETEGVVAARARAPMAVSEEAPEMMMADTMAAPEPSPAQGVQSPSPAAASAMIIRTGTATIKVDSLEPAVVRLRALAASVGGYVGNTSMQTGSDQLRSASVEIKVPASRWGQLVTGLKPIGTLEAVQENAEDVGEEFVDVQARVANAKRLEARLIELLANRTGKLSDALQVERELARVREEIERYQGRIRYLETRAAVSTMTVTVHEPAPVIGSHPGDNPIAQAFRDAWRIFVGFVAFFIASLGVIVPLAVIAVLVWVIRTRVRTKR